MVNYDLDTLFQQMFKAVQISVHNNSIDKCFYKNPKPIAESIALMHSELSEALEAARTGWQTTMDSHLPQRRAVEVEFADVIIRIMDTAQYLGLDVAAAILDKMKYNEGRPAKHGKLF